MASVKIRTPYEDMGKKLDKQDAESFIRGEREEPEGGGEGGGEEGRDGLSKN